MADDPITRFLDTSQAGDIEAAVDCFTDDGRWIMPEEKKPDSVYHKGEIGELITNMNKYHDELLAQGLDGHFETPVFFGEDEALLRWSIRSADGTVVDRGVDLFVLRDGRIALKDVFRKA